MKFQSKSLRFRLGFPILSGITVIMLLLGLGMGRLSAGHAERSLRARGETFASFLQQSTAQYLINFDLSALENFVKKAAEDPDVGFTVFYDERGKPLTESVREPADVDPFFVFERPIKSADGKSLGKLKIGYSKDSLVAARRDNEVAIAATTILSLLIIGAVVYLAVKRVDEVLTSLIEKIARASADLASRGKELESNSSRAAETALESRSMIESTSAALAQISAIGKSNLEHARSAAQLSATGSAAVVAGATQVEHLTSAMGEIAESSSKIHEIVGLIEDIAFQTNLLALNAAVEAARAGEHGKGFAVVAEAVRNLAQKSALASKDIAALVRNAADKTRTGVESSASSATMLKKVVETVNQTASLNQQISSASLEQSSGVSRINDMTGRLEGMTRENSATAEKMRDSSVEMMRQAAELESLVAQLRALAGGEGRSARFRTELRVPA